MTPCDPDALPGVTCVASGSGRFAILAGTELEGKTLQTLIYHNSSTIASKHRKTIICPLTSRPFEELYICLRDDGGPKSPPDPFDLLWDSLKKKNWLKRVKKTKHSHPL